MYLGSIILVVGIILFILAATFVPVIYVIYKRSDDDGDGELLNDIYNGTLFGEIDNTTGVL